MAPDSLTHAPHCKTLNETAGECTCHHRAPISYSPGMATAYQPPPELEALKKENQRLKKDNQRLQQEVLSLRNGRFK